MSGDRVISSYWYTLNEQRFLSAELRKPSFRTLNERFISISVLMMIYNILIKSGFCLPWAQTMTPEKRQSNLAYKSLKDDQFFGDVGAWFLLPNIYWSLNPTVKIESYHQTSTGVWSYHQTWSLPNRYKFNPWSPGGTFMVQENGYNFPYPRLLGLISNKMHYLN